MKTLFILSVTLLLIQFTHAGEMVYEFGVDEGQIIYAKDGDIPILQYQTKINLPVPEIMRITYIRVTVKSLSSPKVDYDDLYKTIDIRYTWFQMTISSYNILVKGILR